MADDRHRRDFASHSRSEEAQYRRQSAPSYPRTSAPEGSRPPPSDSVASHPRPAPAMAATVTLPSIHDAHPHNHAHGPSHGRPGSYAGPPHPRGYPGDPRFGSPNAVNGYPPPSAGQQGPGGAYLPSLQPQGDPRVADYPPEHHQQGHHPQPQRPAYYDDRRPGPPHPAHHGYHEQQQQQQQQQYQSEYYYRGHQPGPPPPGYPQDYRGHPAYAQDYSQSGGDRPREAPRQRTSIACRYCRKRKIRCSGHQHAPGGKCQNCARMNQECIFQPVSSSSSTAFIPVSAVPGGVPPGTQLFGAYGQPLAPGTVPPQPQPQPPAYGPAGAGGPPHHGGHGYYHQSMQSPTDGYPPYGEMRPGEEPTTGMRRRRTPEAREEGYRLPPPVGPGMAEEGHRRRSPADLSSEGSPRSLKYRYAEPARQSPHKPAMPQPPAAAMARDGEGRSPMVRGGSSGSSTSALQGPPTSQGQSSSVMSVSSLVEMTEFDRTMIDRLNRPRDAPTNGYRE